MKFSVTWLKELVEIKMPMPKLAALLNAKSFEVEFSNGKADAFKNIFVAKVVSHEKHPNADRLRVVVVDVGGKIVQPVVCGADNFSAADMVVFASPGARVRDQHDPDGASVTLEKAKIRGVESQGMLLSGFELGANDDRGGIMILPGDAVAGTEYAKYAGRGSDEQTLELDLVTTNRSDIISHKGLAREIAKILGVKAKAGKEPRKFKIRKNAGANIAIEIKNQQLCARYIGVLLKNIAVGPSPEWMVKKLNALGIKSINNVVDVTNYVMLEYGNPLHAFDASRISGKISVRNARANEAIETLDRVSRQMSSDMLVIADEQKSLAIAGVIGGQNSAVTTDTTSILLEGATFNNISVRQTSRKLGLATEASTRFVKGLPPILCEQAVYRAAELLTECAGAKIVEAVETGNYSAKPKVITLSVNFINDLLGTALDAKKIAGILQGPDFKIAKSGSKNLKVQVSQIRTDMNIPEDIVEEIGRLHGYELIPEVPARLQQANQLLEQNIIWRDRLRDFFVQEGYFEAYDYSFVSMTDLVNAGIPAREAIPVSNPLSDDQAFLRPALIMNLMKSVGHNLKYFPSVKLFEIGKIFRRQANSVPLEEWGIAGCISDRDSGETSAYRLLKGALERLDKRYLDGGITFVPAPKNGNSCLSDSAIIGFSGQTVGEIGLVSGAFKKNYGIRHATAYFYLNLEKLYGAFLATKPFPEISKYPSVVYDISAVMDKRYSWAEISLAVRKAAPKELSKIELFDVFTGKNVSAGKRSLAFHLIFQSDTRTLREDEVKKAHENIARVLEKDFQAEIRKD